MWAMIKLNVHEAKTHLSRYLTELQEGEVILLCRRNAPIAEIRALPSRTKEPRPIGLGKGTCHILDGFFDELPREVLEDFEGKLP